MGKKILTRNKEATIIVAGLRDGGNFRACMLQSEFEELNQDLFDRTLEIVKQALSDARLREDQIDEVLMVGGSSRIPKLKAMLGELFSPERLNATLNPDEVVARGAAILASTLEKNRPEQTLGFDLTEVTPRSLSVGILGGTVSCVIKRNTRIPCSNQETFRTAFDNQPSMGIKVFEGERVLQKHNNLLGEFEVKGIRAANEGEVKVLVTFELDNSGCLTVSAKEQGGGASNQITIERAHRRSSEPRVNREVYGAEGHEEEDKIHSHRRSQWNDAYRSIFRLKREIEQRANEPKRQAMMDKCDEVAEWFLRNELAQHDQWKPKIDELRKFCSAQ